eukprot:2054719-Rhodomonas_salina.1
MRRRKPRKPTSSAASVSASWTIPCGCPEAAKQNPSAMNADRSRGGCSRIELRPRPDGGLPAGSWFLPATRKRRSRRTSRACRRSCWGASSRWKARKSGS